MSLHLSDDLYLRFRDLLQKRCGLSYPEHKRADLLHNLGQVTVATGHGSLELLYSDALNNEATWETIVSHLTIGETSFFRNKPQFDAMRQHIVPELIKRRQDLRSLRLWSAGCASGEEPYSLAMLLTDLLPDIHEWHISILATDINPNFLKRAREALYGNWSFREMPEEQRDRFFTREQQRWRLHEHIRRMVTFARLNLAEPCYPSLTNATWALDIILCRNVTIYFSEAVTRQIADQFYRALLPGGWLVVGHAEPQASIYHQFEVHNFPNTVVYRKPLEAAPFTIDLVGGMFNTAPPPLTPPAATPTHPPLSPPAYPSPPEQQQPTWRKAQPAPQPRQPVPPPAALPPTRSTRPPAPPPAPPPAATNRHSSMSTSDMWTAISDRLAQGDKAGAEELLCNLLELEPAHNKALTALGRLCADRGEWRCAQQFCERAIKSDPLALESHYILAQVYEHQGDLDTALAEYRRTVYLDRSFVLGMMGMANVWRQMGRQTEAQRGYRNVLKQLAGLAPFDPVRGAEGVTVRELVSFTMHQLQTLK